MKFTVITPCRNAEGLIQDTIRSLTQQTILSIDLGHELEYILVDGSSEDKTVEVAQAAWIERPNARMTIISEPDQGMYDALVKGFKIPSSSDVVSYLNAGDYYSDHCLAVVGAAFSIPELQWLTGMWVVYTKMGGIFGAKVPWQYSRDLIRRGYHGVYGSGASIQQESTFWRRSLLNGVSMDALKDLRYAGDLYLWSSFAENHELYVAAAHLGGFRYHGNHLSQVQNLYKEEALRFINGKKLSGPLLGLLHKVTGCVPPSIRIRLRIAKRLVAYEIESDTWKLH